MLPIWHLLAWTVFVSPAQLTLASAPSSSSSDASFAPSISGLDGDAPPQRSDSSLAVDIPRTRPVQRRDIIELDSEPKQLVRRMGFFEIHAMIFVIKLSVMPFLLKLLRFTLHLDAPVIKRFVKAFDTGVMAVHDKVQRTEVPESIKTKFPVLSYIIKSVLVRATRMIPFAIDGSLDQQLVTLQCLQVAQAMFRHTDGHNKEDMVAYFNVDGHHTWHRIILYQGGVGWNHQGAANPSEMRFKMGGQTATNFLNGFSAWEKDVRKVAQNATYWNVVTNPFWKRDQVSKADYWRSKEMRELDLRLHAFGKPKDRAEEKPQAERDNYRQKQQQQQRASGPGPKSQKASPISTFGKETAIKKGKWGFLGKAARGNLRRRSAEASPQKGSKLQGFQKKLGGKINAFFKNDGGQRPQGGEELRPTRMDPVGQAAKITGKPAVVDLWKSIWLGGMRPRSELEYNIRAEITQAWAYSRMGADQLKKEVAQAHAKGEKVDPKAVRNLQRVLEICPFDDKYFEKPPKVPPPEAVPSIAEEIKAGRAA